MTITRQLATVVAAALLATLLLSPPALGDADPASDVLLGQDVFYPYNPPVSSSLQATLNAEVAAANKAHFPIKVALIATPVDLGAIPELFGKPRQYAPFLDKEISFAVKASVLVVMPNGYGVAGLSPAATRVADSFAKPSGGTGAALTQAAITAVRKLAAASGHPLRATSSGSGAAGGSGGVALPLAILIAVCGALAAGILALRRRRARTAIRPPVRRR